MKLNQLKWYRILIAAVFFALTAFLYIDIRNLGVQFISKKILYFQFVPSLLKFVNTATAGATGFIVILILTIFFGRLYCSTICPLGTFKDIIRFTARRNTKKAGFNYTPPHELLRYSILALTAVLFAAGGGLLLNLLDPFSSFGRIFSNLMRPFVLAVNNGIAMALEPLGAHWVYQLQWAVIAPLSILVSLATLILIAFLSARHGRLYCNTICPVGTLLGLISKISLFQISIDAHACRQCKRCERVCKAGCIDIDTMSVDATRCVACYNCFGACDKNGLIFKNRWRKNVSATPGKLERRGFILNSAVWLLGIAGIADPAKQIIQSKPTTIAAEVTSPASPPGSLSIEHFTSVCTACHLCVSACPSRVLAPSLLEYGFFSMMQPRMNYHTGYCNYDCTICMDVCPSGALLPLSLKKKKLTQLGVAKFIKKNCVVYTDNTNCGACSEHCPTKAVNMVPYPNPANKKLVIPEVRPEYCIGCGGCEHACPTKPYKAIFVDGNPVHKLAKEPVEQAVDQKVDYKEDFPF